MKVKALILAAVLAFAFSSVASAATITGLGNVGSFSATFDYIYDALIPTEAKLEVAITNTSDAANGGYITGFVFNLPEEWPGATAVTLSADYSSFKLEKNLSAAPYGTFDLGAVLGGSFLGGGNPKPGIKVGDTGVFTFSFISEDNLDFLVSDFISASSPSMYVRLRGFEDGDSDKVPGDIPVPEPASIILVVGAGLGTLVIRRKK